MGYNRTMNITNKDYFTFNVHNSMLLLGQTYSGKTTLVREYMNLLMQAHKPEGAQFVIYDLKQAEFIRWGEDPEKKKYLYTNIRVGTEEDMDYLEELANLAEERAEGSVTTPLIVIYIEECDLAVQYQDRFDAAVMTINERAKAANMKLIYSTSSPRPDTVSDQLANSFDLMLVGPIYPEAMNRFGIPIPLLMNQFEFYVKEKQA